MRLEREVERAKSNPRTVDDHVDGSSRLDARRGFLPNPQSILVAAASGSLMVRFCKRIRATLVV